MKPAVYLETSIIGYLAMRPSRDLRVAANQQTTHEWWRDHRNEFDLFVSRFVVEECRAGDSTAAAEREAFLAGLPFLAVTSEAETLAARILRDLQIPSKSAIDALHISLSAIHRIQYLLTWNCRHIANPSLRPKIEAACREFQVSIPVICTPLELLEVNNGP